MELMKLILVSGLVLSMAFLSACASGPVNGLIYTDVQGPVTATAANRGAMHGTACASSYLGLFAMGDASVAAAAKTANITQISHVDASYTNILFFWAQYCTTVYGNRGITPSAPMKVPSIPTAVPAPTSPTL